jgi:hypothetical protein
MFDDIFISDIGKETTKTKQQGRQSLREMIDPESLFSVGGGRTRRNKINPD